MNTFKLAIRGLNRNRRRSMVTLLAIAIGFSVITLPENTASMIFTNLNLNCFL